MFASCRGGVGTIIFGVWHLASEERLQEHILRPEVGIFYLRQIISLHAKPERLEPQVLGVKLFQFNNADVLRRDMFLHHLQRNTVVDLAKILVHRQIDPFPGNGAAADAFSDESPGSFVTFFCCCRVFCNFRSAFLVELRSTSDVTLAPLSEGEVLYGDD
jgi:hypothetical protein